MGVKLNRSGIAEAMGVSLPTIDRWVREGCPVVQRGQRGVEWIFDSSDVIKWWGDRRAADAAGSAPTDLAEIDKRTRQAAMQRAELELAKAKGEVAPISEFERAQARAFAEVRANVMNVPQRVVVQLLGETNETVFKQKLAAELRLALESSANAALTLGEDDDSDPAGD